jgi:phosphate transport system substrate-binding protein
MEDIIMRVRHSKLLALIGAGILAVTALVACGNGDAATAQPSAVESSAAESTVAESSAAAPAETTTDLSGSISMVGSTSMEKLANALSEAFMEEYPDVTVTAEFVGSGAGIEAVTNGTADIGNSSRSLKDEEKAAGVVENVVAIDGIAVCVDPANEVADLTKEQLTNIYNGTVTNWKEVGGADEPIIVIGREAGSGTRGAFEELVDLKDACKYANELDSTGAVIAKVASTPGAIGYASLDALDDSVKALSLEGVEATAENIKAGNYFLSSLPAEQSYSITIPAYNTRNNTHSVTHCRTQPERQSHFAVPQRMFLPL